MMAGDFPRPFFISRFAGSCPRLAQRFARNLFIIFVDAMFTNLLEPLFTNAFDVHSQTSAHSCVWPACIGD
jgi:hypothetical protein